jgi:hypothetical protein
MRVVLLAHIGFIYQRTHYSGVDDLYIQGTITQSCQGFVLLTYNYLFVELTVVFDAINEKNM